MKVDYTLAPQLVWDDDIEPPDSTGEYKLTGYWIQIGEQRYFIVTSWDNCD